MFWALFFVFCRHFIILTAKLKNGQWNFYPVNTSNEINILLMKIYVCCRYIWQNTIVVDHDYVGLFETATEQSRVEVFFPKEALISAHGESFLRKDLLFSEFKKTWNLHIQTTTLNPKQWLAFPLDLFYFIFYLF